MRIRSSVPHDNEFRAWFIAICFAIIAATISSLIAMGEQFVTGQTIHFGEGWNFDSGYFGISILITGLLLLFGTKATTSKKT